jgi:hypothetical protein
MRSVSLWTWVAIACTVLLPTAAYDPDTRLRQSEKKAGYLDQDEDKSTGSDKLDALLANNNSRRFGPMEMPRRRKAQISIDLQEYEGSSILPLENNGTAESPVEQSTPSPENEQRTCDPDGRSRFPFLGQDSPERLLLREGVIDELPKSRCGKGGRKNVILVIGDGMGWEIARAGAIARRVIDELEQTYGCNITTGCPGNTDAIDAFRGRNLSDYYTQGRILSSGGEKMRGQKAD